MKHIIVELNNFNCTKDDLYKNYVIEFSIHQLLYEKIIENQEM